MKIDGTNILQSSFYINTKTNNVNIDPFQLSSIAKAHNIQQVLINDKISSSIKLDKKKEFSYIAKSSIASLSKLQLQLLEGEIDQDVLNELESSISSLKNSYVDPEAKSILENIELKIEIEKAKLEIYNT